MWFHDYFFSIQNCSVYSFKNGELRKLNPRKKSGEITFSLYANGERFDIRISEILDGLRDIGLI